MEQSELIHSHADSLSAGREMFSLTRSPVRADK